MYAPLNLHTHYSLLKGFSRPEDLAAKAESLGIKSMAIADYDILSGSVNFVKACEKHKIKPILGTKIFISDHNGYVTLLAKNKAGWDEIVKLSSMSYESESSKPNIKFSDLSQAQNVIVIIGEPESVTSHTIIKDETCYISKNTSDLAQYIHTDYKHQTETLVKLYHRTFGKNLFLGIVLVNSSICPIDSVVADEIKRVGKVLNIKVCGLPYSFYVNKENVNDHRLLICSYNKISWDELPTFSLSKGNMHNRRFTADDNSDLKSYDDMCKIYDIEHLENSIYVSELCESYSILDNPRLPKYVCPKGMNESEYLIDLCRAGWKRLSHKLDMSRKDEYIKRVHQELDVFDEVNLAGYFLIVQDYVNWAKSQGMLIGPARGSGGGSLISYLTGITTIDPVIYDLYFERFYNKGRNSPGKISFPDIDVDFPVHGREAVIQYVRDKFGHENVSQVATFSRLQGRGAIKEVFKVHCVCDQELVNIITKRIPQEAEIADKLEESKEHSIIRWTLLNDPEALSEWCRLENGIYSGQFAKYFEQAIRIEGVCKSYGKHASALVISDRPIASICPMIRDKKTKQPLASIEYEELEQMGIPKFDILGVSTLDKLMFVNQLLRYGSSSIAKITKEEEDDE